MNFPEVELWVQASLPPPPARVLEVGAGDGELARSLGGDEPESPAELVTTMRAKVHPIELLVIVLARWFEVGEVARGTYLYRWKLDESLRPAEEEFVVRGELPRTGVRFIARRRER